MTPRGTRVVRAAQAPSVIQPSKTGPSAPRRGPSPSPRIGMKWSFANRLAKPNRSTRSPADMRSGHVTDWPQIWKPMRIGSSGPGRSPRSPGPEADEGIAGLTYRAGWSALVLAMGPAGHSSRLTTPEPATTAEEDGPRSEDRQGRYEDDGCDGVDLGRHAKLDRGVDVQRERRLWPDREERDDELVDRQGDAEQRAGQDRRRDEWQDDVTQRLSRACPQVRGGPLEPPIETLQAGRDDQQDERDGEDEVAGDHGRQGELDVQDSPERQEQTDPEQRPRDHDRQREEEPDAVGETQSRPDQREGGHRPDHRRHHGDDGRDDHGVEDCLLDLAVLQHRFVPLQGQSRDRQPGRIRRLEGE